MPRKHDVEVCISNRELILHEELFAPSKGVVIQIRELRGNSTAESKIYLIQGRITGLHGMYETNTF